ncbi:MAG: response regulator, partial [Candidatus Cloacimonetes bacterium]|nr:response regulator [Candidatus Cloacimonadota bacterium]
MVKYKILIVDDDHTILELVQKALDNENYQLALADNGNQAMELFHKFKPDL